MVSMPSLIGKIVRSSKSELTLESSSENTSGVPVRINQKTDRSIHSDFAFSQAEPVFPAVLKKGPQYTNIGWTPPAGRSRP